MTGGWPGHLLAVEVHLRPVLVELGATVPARGLYVTEPELADLDAAVGKWSAGRRPADQEFSQELTPSAGRTARITPNEGVLREIPSWP